MGKRTFKWIVTLVSLLFLNIEAAQAGLVSRIRLFIEAEFGRSELWYITLSLLAVSAVLYVLFSPVPGVSTRSVSPFLTVQDSYSKRKRSVKNIVDALNARPLPKRAAPRLRRAA